MLEKIGTDHFATISRPDYDVISLLAQVMETNGAPKVAEIGVGIGATTLPMAKKLAGKGEIHIFDFHESVDELSSDLKREGFGNVFPHGNTSKHWDSYHWSLSKLLREPSNVETFDLIYIDGSHTYLHDALAFFMCDRLLKVGGTIVFDDYVWRYADSRYMKDVRDQFMTKEQEESRQVALLVEELVKTHIGYEMVIESKAFRKIASTCRRS